MAPPSPDVGQTPVVVFSRVGCHLCDDVVDVLRELQRTYLFDFIVVDVDDDPGTRRDYGHAIPVVKIGDDRELVAPISEAELASAISRFPRRPRLGLARFLPGKRPSQQ